MQKMINLLEDKYTGRYIPALNQNSFINISNQMNLVVDVKQYFIDAEWDGGKYSDIVAIPEYALKDSNDKIHYIWNLNLNILEYLCGKGPVDIMDELNLKKDLITPKRHLFIDFPLNDTYYKNLKINRLEKTENE